jgi:hypothetical protein
MFLHSTACFMLKLLACHLKCDPSFFLDDVDSFPLPENTTAASTLRLFRLPLNLFSHSILKLSRPLTPSRPRSRLSCSLSLSPLIISSSVIFSLALVPLVLALALYSHFVFGLPFSHTHTHPYLRTPSGIQIKQRTTYVI